MHERTNERTNERTRCRHPASIVISLSPAADPGVIMGCLIIYVLVLTYLAKSYGREEVHDYTSICPKHCHAELGWGSCQPHKREGRHAFAAGSAIRMHFRKTPPQRSCKCKAGHGGSCKCKAGPEGSCKCKAGHGGKDCSFQMKTIYFSEDVYSGLDLQPLDLQGWGSGLPETVAMYKRLCEVRLRVTWPALSVTMPAGSFCLLQEVQPNLIIEVGVWKGQSASHFAGKHQLPSSSTSQALYELT